MIKQLKAVLAFALCFTIPAWGVYAAAPEMPALVLNVQGVFADDTHNIALQSWDLSEIQNDLPAMVDDNMMQALFPAEGIIPMDVTIELDNLSDEELEIALQDELFIGQDASFWNRTRIIAGGLIVVAGIIMILMLFISSAGGAGSGGGSGSGGGDTGGQGGGIPPIGGGPLGGDGGGGGDQCGATITCLGGNADPTSGRSNAPMNPEPSTLLLIGLGLLLPLVRRKA